MAELYHFEGQSFEQLTFNLISKKFNTAYRESIKKNSNLIFVKFYNAQGQPLERTFEEFDIEVQKISNYLIENYSDYDIICTKSENTYEHMVYIAAILISDFIFCPLNPGDSSELTSQKLLKLGKAILIQNLDLNIKINELLRPPKRPSQKKSFINIFTSGSTGDSKIVEQTEAGVLTNVEGLLQHHLLNSSKTTIATPLPLFHVNALEFSFLCCLLGGHKLILYENFDPLLLLKTAHVDQIEIFSLVPHLLHGFKDFLDKFNRLKSKNFKYFISAASPLPLNTFLEYASKDNKILQGYGLSESVNFSLLTPPDISLEALIELAKKYKRPPSGTAIWGTEIKVCNEKGEACPPGEIGNVSTKGPCVMLGYKNFDSQESFADGWLKTGDLGFWTQEMAMNKKTYFICGRTKDIAKKSGITTSLVSLDEALKILVTGEITDIISFSFEDNLLGEDIGIVIQTHESKKINFTKTQNLIASLVDKKIMPSVLAITSKPLRTRSGKPLRWQFSKILTEKNTSKSISNFLNLDYE